MVGYMVKSLFEIISFIGVINNKIFRIYYIKKKEHIRKQAHTFLRNIIKFFHIAQSKWVSDDLKGLNFKHKLLLTV